MFLFSLLIVFHKMPDLKRILVFITQMYHWSETSRQQRFLLRFQFGGGVFQDRVSLCSSGCLRTQLELRDSPVSASQKLGLKVCTTTAQLGQKIF